MAMSNNQAGVLGQAQPQINQINDQIIGEAYRCRGKVEYSSLLQRISVGSKVDIEPAQFNQIQEKFKHFLTYQRDFKNAFKLAFESKGGFDDDLNGMLQLVSFCFQFYRRTIC